MFKKILSFIVNEKNELLLLRNNPEDPAHGGDMWYTVTGGFEDYETDGKDVAIREIKEETNLDVKETIYLNWIYKYTYNKIDCIEYAYISFVEGGNIVLEKEENIDYRWCDFNTFIENIKWYGDISVLEKVLKDAINKKVYFENEQIENYIGFDSIKN